ncbi:MAG: Flp pilus assembly complex ATPase component TadA [Pseudobacteriovorax sp.]|nr:Flp pilus assembly complex ATPase component TadA [Pseudobacteriovorax sp.]
MLLDLIKQVFLTNSCQELLINGSVIVTKIRPDGTSESEASPFSHEEEAIAAIREFCWSQSIRLDPLLPSAGSVMTLGSLSLRWHVIIPPMSFGVGLISVRRQGNLTWDLSAFTQDEVCRMQLEALKGASIVLFGGETGSGKTTLLSHLAKRFFGEQRVFIIETVPELERVSSHWIQLVTQESLVDGTGQVTCSDLLFQSLRMRPDRYIFGEIRGPEAKDLFHLMSSASAGVWSTIHTNSPEVALQRLSLLSGISLSEWQSFLGRSGACYVQLSRRDPRVTGIYQYNPDGVHKIYEL